MSSSSLRQHQRKSATNTSGHSPLARNHSVGAPPHHHSSSTSVSTNRSYRSLPSPGITTTTTTTTPTTTAPLTTTNVLSEDDDNNQQAEKSPNNNNIFSFENRMNNFHNSSFHQKTSEKTVPSSTRLLCGSLIPLQNSLSSSSSINHRSIENENLNSPIFPPLLRKSDIKYRNLGRNGLRVSQLGLGTWVTFGGQISDDVAEELVTIAYDSGINLFDTAEVYAAGKAEITLGKVLKKKKWKRSSYIVSTKLFWGGKAETEKGLSRKHVIEGLRASLERLQLDYVDIVFANKPDTSVPMEEIVRAFTQVINDNLCFYWGTSRWSPMEIMEAYSVARQFNLIPPICEQAEYHLFQRDKVEVHLPEIYHKIGIGTMTWSPLACGLLSGKYDDGVPLHSRAALKGYGWLKDKILNDEGRRQQSKLRELAVLAAKFDCTLAQLTIAWCLKNDNVHCVLLGASSVEQLYENINSLQIVSKLTPAIMADIDRILGNKPVARTSTKGDISLQTQIQIPQTQR